MTADFPGQSFEKKKYWDIKFHRNPCSGGRDVPCGQTDRQAWLSSCSIHNFADTLYQGKRSKVKQSRYRPGVAQRVPASYGSQISWQRHGMVVSLPALITGRLYPQEILLVLISVKDWADPRTIVQSEGFYVNKKFQWHQLGSNQRPSDL